MFWGNLSRVLKGVGDLKPPPFFGQPPLKEDEHQSLTSTNTIIVMIATIETLKT
jgi:hypothetical protein